MSQIELPSFGDAVNWLVSGASICSDTIFYGHMRVDNCLIEEEALNKDIASSIQAIEAGEEFAFYNLGLSSKDKEILDSIEVVEWVNVVLNSEHFNTSLEKEIWKALGSMKEILATSYQINYLSHLFTRLTSVILGQVGSNNFEMHIRTKDTYNDTQNCTYWHLDKSHAEVLWEESIVKEKRFIIPLKGSLTRYQKITTETRSKFLSLACEYIYYYGHGPEGCVAGDEISSLLNSSKIYKPETGFGSVHVASRNGAMHAEPNESSDRLLLVITPIEQ